MKEPRSDSGSIGLIGNLKRLLNKLTKKKLEESCSSEVVSGCSTLKAHRTCPESGKTCEIREAEPEGYPW